MGKTLFEKVWDAHSVKTLSNGQTQLLIGTHLIHEVTSPQAFGMLSERGLSVRFPKRTFATVDHIVPTNEMVEPYSDSLAQGMIEELRNNCAKNNITFFDTNTGHQGIVHIVGPEQGITQPGTTIACGDSHTSTHGAFGAIAFGIGTSQVRDVLATQTIALNKLKVRRINVNGKLAPGVYAKDVILHIIRTLGTNGGTGFAYEYGGEVFDGFSMEERMTVCNMSIEGGARIGYVNPDQTTFDYINGREYAPKGQEFDDALAYWKSIASSSDAEYDDVVEINGSEIEPMITWGINPEQSIGVSETVPHLDQFSQEDHNTVKQAYDYMKLSSDTAAQHIPINVAFVGSCTNSRLSDLQEAAHIVKGKKVNDNVKMIVVPGSQQVKKEAEKLGLDKIFEEAGAEWRHAGCSMCLAMNADKLKPEERCASTSNRNFEGRQGRGGRTHLVSPGMAAAAAISGNLDDVRKYQN